MSCHNAVDQEPDDDHDIGLAVIFIGCLIIFWVLRWLFQSADRSK